MGDTKLLPHLTMERLLHVLAQVYMPSNSGIPFVGLNVFPLRTVLKIEFSLAVENMKVNYGVENLAAIVGMTATYGPEKIAVLVYDGKLLVFIVLHCRV